MIGMRKTTPRLRWMISKDLDQVMKIEEESFHDPWCREAMERFVHIWQATTLVAFGPREKIVGYLMYLWETDHLKLINLAVDCRNRRQGIATMMADRMKRDMGYTNRKGISLAIPERNLSAQLWAKSNGFLAEKIFVAPKSDQDDVFGFSYSAK